MVWQCSSAMGTRLVLSKLLLIYIQTVERFFADSSVSSPKWRSIAFSSNKSGFENLIRMTLAFLEISGDFTFEDSSSGIQFGLRLDSVFTTFSSFCCIKLIASFNEERD